MTQLHELIDAGKIDPSTEDDPLFYQDDNCAGPPQDVGQLICRMAANDFDIVLRPADGVSFKCSLRGGWRHDACARAFIGKEGYERFTGRGMDDDDDWFCPHLVLRDSKPT